VYNVGIQEKLRNGLSNLKNKVEEFKANHTTISLAVSEIINSLPGPFDAFGRILWDSLEQKDDSAEKVLTTLQKMMVDEEIAFMKITTNIEKLMETNPTKVDILQVSEQIRESEKSIIDILATKIDQLSKQVEAGFGGISKDMKAGFGELKQMLSNSGIQPSTIDPNFKPDYTEKFRDKIRQLEQKVEQQESQLSKEERQISEYINLLIQRGNYHYLEKEYKVAIGRFDSVLDIDKENVIALTNKGAVLHQLEEYKEAIVCYDKVLEVDPKYVSALTNKGAVLHQLEEYKEAIVWFDKALEVDPKHVNALNNKGLALDTLGEYKEAIVWYDKALEVDPKHVGVLYNKGLALGNLGEYKEAMVWYDKALEVDPKYVSALYNKGLALGKPSQCKIK